jgi:hypothetical protein
MNDAKYIGMDVHQATISVAVRDSRGNLVMEAILETKADTILEFIHGLRGSCVKQCREVFAPKMLRASTLNNADGRLKKLRSFFGTFREPRAQHRSEIIFDECSAFRLRASTLQASAQQHQACLPPSGAGSRQDLWQLPQ